MDKEKFKYLDKLAEEGYLRRIVSPCGKLILYNYTDKCTYDKKWNKHTINARGTVYELASGDVVAYAFPKFFNFEELPKSKARNLAKKTHFTVTEKVDGSLGVIYNYDGEWRVNTRGSFNSEQAIEATKMLKNQYDTFYLSKEVTYLCEIIYPENKIIVDYKDERKLVLLAAFHKDTGEEVDLTTQSNPAHLSGLELVDRRSMSFQQLLETQSTLSDQEEGFVVRFEDGYRVKFKSKEYLKVAKAISNITPLNFWRNMSHGEINKDFLSIFPEELRSECDNIVKSLRKSYYEVYDKAKKEAWGLISKAILKENPRKYIAQNQANLTYRQTIFAFFDNDEALIDKAIMEIIRPNENVLIEDR